jgi:predicted nucleic acid-binding protein
MRPPSSALVVDTSVLIALVRGRGSQALVAAAETRELVVTKEALREAERRIEFGMKAPQLIPKLHAAVEMMTIIPNALGVSEAEGALRDAVASRNGSVKDSHILACAWAFDADIWSFDRDFAGTGVASWSTPNLMRALATSADTSSPN